MSATTPATPTTQHDTFTIERRYPVAPKRVFRAFADRDTKVRWFGCVEGWEVAEHTLDFRVGGREVWRGSLPESGKATPMSYRLASGEQFVAIAVGGGGAWGAGDSVVAFHLRRE